MARLSGYLSRRGGLHPEEASALRQATSRLFNGQNKAETCRWVNAQGYRTTLGNEWTPEVLVRVLSHPRMAGLDDEGNPVEDFGPTVLTPDEYFRLQALFVEQKSQQPQAREAFDYLLTHGGAECGKCKYDMVGTRVSGDADPSYRCPPPRAGQASCGRVRMNADRLEDTVAEAVLAELMRPGAQEHLARLLADMRAEAKRLEEHIAGAVRRFEELRGMRDALVPAAYAAAEKATKDDLRESRNRLRFLEQMIDLPIDGVASLVEWWNSAPRASQRALVRLEIAKVRVLAAGRGKLRDPRERVLIDWRRPPA
ncbi:recombinase zinc beta ribbon domain-containing protein [Streptomyces sp. NBC_01304]|uniref:recombinase zinc beta ribbon domain-containing protein n=1 Tax=Streptomyces sp. NBC_01304 TaxID=2903818 RepID=UPI002E1440D0|nr:recombinase family protein [Streptomyces sp. NBC_01304]